MSYTAVFTRPCSTACVNSDVTNSSVWVTPLLAVMERVIITAKKMPTAKNTTRVTMFERLGCLEFGCFA